MTMTMTNSTTTSNTKRKKKMTQAEKLKIIMSDPILWIETFVQIPDKAGRMIPFKLNPLQKDFMESWEKYNIILKARQLGFSTLICGLSLYYACTQPNSSILLVSYSGDSATAIFDRLKVMYNSIPDAVKPKFHANNKKEIKLNNGSRIICATAGNKELARGMTLKLVHLSEYAFWNDKAPEQLLAIEQALSGRLVIESTPNGLNHLHDLWNRSASGENMYKTFFYNWYSDTYMYRDEITNFCKVWKSRHGRLPEPDELDDEELRLLEKGATIEQLVWRRLKINNSNPEQFNQEFASDPVSCFASSSRSVFNVEEIIERLKYIDSPQHKEPESLPAVLKPHWKKGFFLWRPPVPGKRYFIGVDVAEGVHKDYSYIVVLSDEGEQVAEFYSNKIKPYELAEIVAYIGTYYNSALIVVEKMGGGDSVLSRLRHDFTYLNLFKSKAFDQRGKKKKKLGFVTNQNSKSMIINDVIEGIDKGQILIQSSRILDEMKTFVADPKSSRMEAMKGRYDDGVMSVSLAFHGLRNPVNYI